MNMNSSESAPEFGGPSEKSEIPENQSHLVTPYVFEIDLSRPDRADEYLMELVTGIPESKLVAEIECLDDRIGIIHVDSEKVGSYVVLTSAATGEREIVNPGTAFDLDEEGGCVISVDETGSRIVVYSEIEDWQYILHADEVPLSQYELSTRFEVPYFEDSIDDPEY